MCNYESKTARPTLGRLCGWLPHCMTVAHMLKSLSNITLELIEKLNALEGYSIRGSHFDVVVVAFDNHKD